MRAKQFESWWSFCDFMAEYMDLEASRRRQIIFRGQADHEWELASTLDRIDPQMSNDKRDEIHDDLVKQFRRSTHGLAVPLGRPTGSVDWELLGRHHGLATPVIDWTESPWIAAYFAFHDQPRVDSSHVAVWCLDRNGLLTDTEGIIEIVEDEDAIRFNPRAIEQRGLFMRVVRNDESLESLLGKHLLRFDIPVSERKTALAALDEQCINARSLFRDLDGAASWTNRRVLVYGGE